MKPEEMNDKFEELTAQVDTMSQKLEEDRESRSELLRQRFDLKEQRRYFRAQLREAENAHDVARIGQVGERLTALDEQIEALDDKLTDLEESIDETSDQMDDLMDQVEDIRDEVADAIEEQAEEVEEAAEDAGEKAASGEDPMGDFLTETMEKLNSLLTRGFKRVADTLEGIDFEKVGENVTSAAHKAYKTVEGVATDAARNVESAWNDAKETREQPGGIGDYRSSGSSTIDGGCYNRIATSGACKVSSDLVCREMRVSGSFRALGSVDCNGSVRTAGATQIAGKLIAGSLVTSGSTKVGGGLEAGPVTSTGGLTVEGDVKATAMTSSGSLRVTGNLEADSFHTTGGLDIGGELNADVVDISLAVGQCTVGSIGGSDVKVHQSAATGLLNSLGAKTGTLNVGTVEGDKVELEGVKAQIVRGATVVIGSGCEIGQVEYTETCSISTDAHVEACAKI